MPTEQRCGTCKHYDHNADLCVWGGVIPTAYCQPYLLHPDDGRGCKCWAKIEPADKETTDG